MRRRLRAIMETISPGRLTESLFNCSLLLRGTPTGVPGWAWATSMACLNRAMRSQLQMLLERHTMKNGKVGLIATMRLPGGCLQICLMGITGTTPADLVLGGWGAGTIGGENGLKLVVIVR